MRDEIDEALAEADLLRGHIIAGTLKARHVELPDDDPRVPDTDAQRADRMRRAHVRAVERDKRRRAYFSAQEAYGIPSPYPARPSEDQLRELCNELVVEHGFDPGYLAARYGLSRRTR